jgi:rhodanese-related sulfurtransferase
MVGLRTSAKEAMTAFEGGNVVFVDVRNPQAWRESNVKLPGAIRTTLDDVERLVDKLPRGKEIVTYCT